MKLYTIGFTQKTAQRFFELLAEHGVERVVDIRLKPAGQLSGFAKAVDLAWFLQRLNGCDYIHLPRLAPPADLLSDYRTNHVKTSIVLVDIDVEKERLAYFHGPGYFEMQGEDFREGVRAFAEKRAPRWQGR